ncbi:hypothetical protein, partial [Cetobacterium sp.]|uniref:hypothetical protein n=1 Tax=Cetobacterium sp. TaxID=2071632 RepID=UPI003F2FF452
MISSTFNFIYNFVKKPSVDLHEDQRFSDIFFDKFKNLLDDYIVNYQIKYFFYLLFISFFYLELSEGMFQFLHNYSPYHLSIFGSFIIDFCYSLFNISIIDFLYEYFAFNLNFITYGISLLSNHDIYTSILIMGITICIITDTYERIKKLYDVKVIGVVYLMYSFFLFTFIYFNIISLNFYMLFTLLIFIFSFYNTESTFNSIDRIIFPLILSFIFLPYYIILFFVALVAYWLLDNNMPLIYNGSSRIKNLNISFFGDLLLIGVLSFFIIHLGYA